MGRIFETRKHTMFARWNKMAKAFTRVTKEITIAVKAGGISAESNPALRRAIQNARAVNMPKDKVDTAIKRASGQDQKDYETIVYEGYAPHGVPVIVETATDNVVRTVANVRMHFKDWGGNMGNAGSVGSSAWASSASTPPASTRNLSSSTSSTTACRSSESPPARRAKSSSSFAATSPTSASCSRPSKRGS
jgi:hypothetical protein